MYPGDWMKDPALRACSVAARGLWIDMVCLMFESTQRGVLLVNNMPATEKHVSRMTGVSPANTKTLLAELKMNGVCSIRENDGAIYSRRMVRDEALSSVRREAGKLGGNPNLLNHEVGVLVNQSCNQKATPSSSSSASSSSSEVRTPLPPAGGGEVDPLGFSEFWQAWPQHFRKGGRSKCVKHWRENGLSTAASEIVHSLGAWKASEQWAKDRGQFIPAPIVWLRKRPWEAASPPEAQAVGDVQPRNESAYARAKRQLSERESA